MFWKRRKSKEATSLARSGGSTADPADYSSLYDWHRVDQYLERDYLTKAQQMSALDRILLASFRTPEERDSRVTTGLTAKEKWVQAVIHEEVPADYTGPRITWPLTEAMVTQLIAYIKGNPWVPLPRRYVVEVLLAARDQARELLPGRVVELQIASEKHQRLVVVGDLHGQLSDLLLILGKFGLPGPDRAQFIFNGDFVDRGHYGVEVIFILLALRLTFPKSMHLNRGNHEDASVTIEHGFWAELQQKYGTEGFLFDLCMDVFELLPLATVVDRYLLVVHGGLPRQDGILIKHINSLPVVRAVSNSPVTSEDVLTVDLLWSDPRQAPGKGVNHRGPAVYEFGPDVTKKFLKANKLSLVIRSHEVPDSLQGYETWHGGSLITVFSASNYTGCGGNQGAVALLNAQHNLTFFEYMAPPLKVAVSPRALGIADAQAQAAQSASEDITRHILTAVCEQRQQFVWFLKQVDSDGSGWVTMEQWKRAMSSILGFSIPWEKYCQSLVSLAAFQSGRVNYLAFVNSISVECDAKYQGWMTEVKRKIHDTLVNSDLSLKDMKSYFDLNSDGKVDEKEMAEIATKLQLGLTPYQVGELLRGMGTMEEGSGGSGVDVMTFLENLQTLRTFTDTDRATRETLQRLADHLLGSGVPLVESFTRFDTNGDGKLQYAELAEAIQGVLAKDGVSDGALTTRFIERVARILDVNQSGTIDYMEFVDALKRTSGGNEGIQNVVQHICQTLHSYRFSLEKAFQLMDTNKDGYLTPDEFLRGLRSLNVLLSSSLQISDNQVELIARHIDLDGDGRVAWSEFLQAFRVQDAAAPSKVGKQLATPARGCKFTGEDAVSPPTTATMSKQSSPKPPSTHAVHSNKTTVSSARSSAVTPTTTRTLTPRSTASASSTQRKSSEATSRPLTASASSAGSGRGVATAPASATSEVATISWSALQKSSSGPAGGCRKAPEGKVTAAKPPGNAFSTSDNFFSLSDAAITGDTAASSS